MRYEAQEQINKQAINFLVEDRYRPLRHTGLLLGFLLLIYFSNFPDKYSGVYKYYTILCLYSIFIGMFYVNMYVLVPKFFFKARYLVYLVILVALVLTGLSCVTYVLGTYFEEYRSIEDQPRYVGIRGYYEGMLTAVPIILLTTTIKLLQRWTKDNRRITELKNLTLSIELNELKNQINPHFLFNMLNNVKALTRRDPEKASAVITKLSDFLRYQLYENNEDKTPLISEMNFLTNFMDLEKIRRDKFSVNIHSHPDNRALSNIFVPPNLFTTFVENAVKHSVDITDNEAYINIDIKVDNKTLYFTCVNSKTPDYTVSNKKYSGLGLANIKRRLDLLYQDKHVLKIVSTDTEYSVHLTIPI